MNQHKPLETIIEDTQVTRGTNPKENYKTINAPDYLFVARPVEAGQSSELIVMEQLGRRSRDPIERIVLLKDGNEIASTEEIYLNYEVVQETEGSYTYTAELHTKSGRKIKTDAIEITFTGQQIDFPPYIRSFISSTQKAGKATNILVDAEDIGDNRGIKTITLYEDGKPIEIVDDSDHLLRNVQYDSPQTHEYHAEVKDKGGQIVTTEKITVSYSGEAFPPLVSWFSANPDKVGRTTRILVEGKDDKNYDDLQGIARIVLYEDGKQIHEEEGSTLLFEATHNKAGTHQYHAKIHNKNNRKTTTKTFVVNFTGQDFPPEVSCWHINYKPEEGLATVLVEGKDEKNVRDDAGIRQIVLFEDRKPIKTVEGATLLEKLTRQAGTHSYYAEITNNSGLITKTDEKTVSYQAR